MKSVTLRSTTAVLVAFVSGLLLMYIVLLERMHPPRDTLSMETALQELANAEGVDVQLLEQQLLENYRRQDVSKCNGTSPTNVTCSTSVTGSPDRKLSWDAIQAVRRLTIRQTCADDVYTPSSWSPRALWRQLEDNENMYLDDKHRVFFCAIPKAACSSWKAALAILTNKLPDKNPGTLKNIHVNSFMAQVGLVSPAGVSESHLYKAITDYTKVMVVRHPFERLVSAYRDKFHTYNKWTKHFQQRYGRKIVLLYRGHNVTVEALKKGNDVTFEEFLTYITDDTVPAYDRINPHWTSYQQLCRPCHVSYDHVIKFESLDEDNAQVLKRYFSVINSTEFFPKRNVKEIPSKDIMVQYYSHIPKSIIKRIYNMFLEDMRMFNYDLPPEILDNHLR